MATTAYLSLGTNQGERRRQLAEALALLASWAGTITAASKVAETAPWGFSSPHPFLNMAVAIETELTPMQLLDTTQQIERTLGRTRKSPAPGQYADRPIDIDIVLYGEVQMQSPRLTLPHPLMEQRRFVLEPLAQIAPHARHPRLGKSVRQLLCELTESGE